MPPSWDQTGVPGLALGTRSCGDLLQHRIDACEAALRALFDAVLHGGVPLLGGLEAHRLRQIRLLTEILELERLQMVLERLHEALGRIDLAELALDGAVRGPEAVGPAGPDVHLLDDRAVAPPFGDQLRIRPDGVDVRTRRIEDALDPDLEFARSRDGGGVHQPTAFLTSAAILASSAAVNFVSAKAIGHMEPSSSFAVSLKPNIAYRSLNFPALRKKQRTLPSFAYAGIPYQVFGERSGAVALMSSWSRLAMARSGPCISAIFASTSLSPSALSARGPRRPATFSSWARSFIAARSSSVNPLDFLPIAVVLLADFCVAFFALIVPSFAGSRMSYSAQQVVVDLP